MYKGKEETDKFTNVHLVCMDYRYLYEFKVNYVIFNIVVRMLRVICE